MYSGSSLRTKEEDEQESPEFGAKNIIIHTSESGKNLPLSKSQLPPDSNYLSPNYSPTMQNKG